MRLWLALLTERSEMRTNAGLSPRTILCGLARGDLEFWSAAEKLQMTAVCVSQNGFAKTTKVR